MTNLKQAAPLVMLALEAAEELAGKHDDAQLEYGFHQTITALKDALEQPPAEWELIKNILAEYGLDAIAFVAQWKAAQRPWVGLEIEEVQDSYNRDYQAQTRAIEAKLKERNT